MSEEHKIKVLVVENTGMARASMVHILNADPRMQVIGTVRSGTKALQFLSRRLPDVILMDIDVPEMDSLEATRRIMETQPVPIIICSGSVAARSEITPFQLLEAGAVACVERPMGRHGEDFAAAAHLLLTVKLMSEVKVVHRWPRVRRNGVSVAIVPTSPCMLEPAKVDFIGIGASTGGPPVLKTILDGLPKDFPVPVLIVQHIAKGFLSGLVDWLNRGDGMRVHVAEHGTLPLPGHVYLAPDDLHMAIGSSGQIILSGDEPDNGLRPSVSRLFHSLAEACGPSAVGVLLSGMGKDGAVELKRMRDRGAATIVQDRKTSVVHGMPGEAIALGAAGCILPADQIAAALINLIYQQSLPQGAVP
jgi:two-component system chemotaxis response regulator CheB